MKSIKLFLLILLSYDINKFKQIFTQIYKMFVIIKRIHRLQCCMISLKELNSLQ